jgi:pSer/pThr/pTyr-binding forkhead associated (FHA) protein
MYKLVISDDEGKTIIVPLVRDLITVGRQDGNTIRLTERNVSRRHARLTRDDKDNYRIEDLGSFNGITLNGVKIDKVSELKDGDRIGIGDYVIALRAEASAVAPRPSSKRGSAPTGFGAAPPARLVMISSPAPGAEFSLSKSQVTIGRLEELDLCISHRSISREHARVNQEGGAFEIEDQRSANGVRVNGSTVKKANLRSGDIVELGQVRFRFVGPGESYVFDPTDEPPLMMPSSRSGPRRGAVAGLIILAAVGGGSMAVLHDGSKQAGAAMRKDEPAEPVNVDPTPSTEALPVDQAELASTLKRCEEGLRDGRPKDALRSAEQGMALRGSGDELAQCKRSATDAIRANEAFEQGTKALAENKLEDAYFLFAGIPDGHAFRDRPEVKNAIERVADDRLARARRQVKSAPAEARKLAHSVLEMQDVPAAVRDEAQRLVDGSARPAAAGPTAAQQNLVTTKQRATPSGEPSEEAEDPAKVARGCLARGDQRCVVKALEGKADSAQELALLIETYRALGETKKAVKHMETFVARFATARQTPQYRQFIAKHEQ